MDPFAAALNALFRAPGSSDAVYQAPGGDPVALRAVVGQPDQRVKFGGGSIVQGTHEVQLRRSDVAYPETDAILTVVVGSFLKLDGTITSSLRIAGDPVLDVEGLTWTCAAEPA